MIDVADRGLQYGDGVFETIAVSQGNPLLWSQHMTRLCAGCERLAIPIPDTDLLRIEAEQLCQNKTQAVLKIIITPGRGGRGYRRPTMIEAQRILSVHVWPDYSKNWHQQGVNIRICETRLSEQPRLAGIKHLNRLEQVLARSEWQDTAFQEGLMLSINEHVIAGTMSNVFLVKQNTVLTPDLSLNGIAGVMRERILHHLSVLDITYKICQLSIDDVLSADEVFLTNCIAGLWPVKRIAEQPMTVGPISQRLLTLLTQEMVT